RYDIAFRNDGDAQKRDHSGMRGWPPLKTWVLAYVLGSESRCLSQHGTQQAMCPWQRPDRLDLCGDHPRRNKTLKTTISIRHAESGVSRVDDYSRTLNQPLEDRLYP